MRFTCLAAALLFALSGGGCATIIRGTHQTLEFDTVPTGAEVIIDGKPYTSPISVSLKRNESHTVYIKMKGYRPEKFVVDPEWDGVSLVGNIIMPGGSVGLIADHVDGSDMAFHDLAEIKLEPTTQPATRPVVFLDFKGHLLTDSEVQEAIDADRRDHSQFFEGQP